MPVVLIGHERANDHYISSGTNQKVVLFVIAIINNNNTRKKNIPVAYVHEGFSPAFPGLARSLRLGVLPQWNCKRQDMGRKHPVLLS
jgi:hypothetical protein